MIILNGGGLEKLSYWISSVALNELLIATKSYKAFIFKQIKFTDYFLLSIFKYL
jgi:hypothetical protein